MEKVFFALYLLFGAVHLYHSWKDDMKRRKLTKPLLMLTLALYYAASATKISWLLLMALLTSWLGDVMLIPKGHRWFARGGVFFLISHVLFMAVCVPSLRMHAVPWLLVALMAPAYYGTSVWIMTAVSPTTPKKMIKPMGMYLLTNSTMNLMALVRMFSMRSIGSVVVYAGALLFFMSDCTLFFVRYYRKPEVIFKKHFTVMATYLAGEFFMTLGILMQ